MKGLRVARMVAWIVVVLVLGGILVYGVKNSGFHFARNNTQEGFNVKAKQVKTEQVALDGVNQLDLNFTHHGVNLILTDDAQMTVEQWDTNDLTPEELFTVDRSGSLLRVGIENTKKVRVGVFLYVESRIDVYLPRAYAQGLTATTTSGGIYAQDLLELGDVTMKTSSGAQRLESGVKANALRLTATSGSVRVGNVEADSLEAGASSGTVRLGDVTAKGSVYVHTTSGGLSAGAVTAGGDVRLESSSGSVRTDTVNSNDNIQMKATSGGVSCERAVAAGNLKATTSSGTMRMGSASANRYELSASSGGISVEQLSGSGTVKTTSGTLRVGLEKMTGDVALGTSSGGLTVNAASAVAFRFTGSNTSGGIHVDFPLSVDKEHSKAGEVGAQPQYELKCSATSGSIRVQTQ